MLRRVAATYRLNATVDKSNIALLRRCAGLLPNEDHFSFVRKQALSHFLQARTQVHGVAENREVETVVAADLARQIPLVP